ncbi:hypothetical protein AB0M79_28525 [Polymorphospora sp. NPDC051019]|uniref:hypothetical protein n=1 Tax=Polymorphospora sp. NPDC051019 TaxID=3155725 RepID=UPI00343B6345
MRSGIPATSAPLQQVADQAANVIVDGGRQHTINAITNQTANGASDKQATGSTTSPTAITASRAAPWRLIAWISIGALAPLDSSRSTSGL